MAAVAIVIIIAFINFFLQFSPSVIPDSLRPLGLQHARLPCPSPIPGACSSSCPLSLLFTLTQIFLWQYLLFSHEVVSDSFPPHQLLHTKLPCLSPSRSVLKFLFIELVMPSKHLILYRSLLLLPSVFPSIRVFYNESSLHFRWPKYWSFSISPSLNIQS